MLHAVVSILLLSISDRAESDQFLPATMAATTKVNPIELDLFSPAAAPLPSSVGAGPP
jgi:hypothetical protein